MATIPRSDQPALIIPEINQMYPLEKERLTIGRKTDNTIVLPSDDLKASRYHAAVSWKEGRYYVQDAGSANGTFLNGRRIEAPHPLSDGDIIEVGDTKIQVQLPAADTEPSIHQPSPVDQTMLSTAGSADETNESMMRVARPKFLENPYVGPRTFTRKESDRFFGRELEARDLFSLVISDRLVLFYAQSGAGKSSLINTRLIPQLQEAGFPVLPVARVTGDLPEGIGDVDNIYVFNLMLSMDESDSDPDRFTQMKLVDFLTRLTSLDGIHYFYDPDAPPELEDEEFQATPYVLLIDQFEEIVTTHPERWQEREQFFKQLAEAMNHDPYLWVVLSLREDYVATLDAYAHLLPGNMRARFYMQRMDSEAALEAVRKPAEKFGRNFAPGVAESLVDNLRQIRVAGVEGDDRVKTEPGQFVEPVQLQVVCYQLWENLIDHSSPRITYLDLEELGDVDEALGDFYEQALEDVMRAAAVPEIDLRNWFESELITEAGTRGTVYRGKETTGDIDNRAVDLLVEKFLLRSEVRAGGTWYELVHDRFIEPILQANREWRLRQPLIKFAQDWAQSGRPDSGLLEGQPLKEALASNWHALGPLVKEFLEASQAAQEAREAQLAAEKLQQAQALAAERQKRLEEEAKASAGLRRRALWITVIGVVAFALAIVAGGMAVWALQSQSRAEAEAATAIAAQEIAQAESTRAAANEAEARRLLAAQQTVQAESDSSEDAMLNATATVIAQIKVGLTAEAATRQAPTSTPLPTPTPLPPTSTPIGTFAPPPTGTPTPYPTVTPPPTPDVAATKTVQALQVAIDRFEVVQQVAQTSCKIEPVGTFAATWGKYQNRLGCPLYQEPQGGYFAEQPFERGYMFWYSIYDVIYVTVGDESGWWESFTKRETDSYNPSDTGSCRVEVPKGLVQPVRGFGAVWCAQEEIREEIGFGLTKEFGTGDDLLQEFEQGLILRDSRGRTYVLFQGETDDSGTYRRE